MNELEQMASIKWNPQQDRWFKQRLADAKPVSVISMQKVVPEFDDVLVKGLGFEKKQCYKNASLMTSWLYGFGETDKEIKYVEGMVCDPECPLPISHAWVKIGDQYIDPTFEKVLERNVEECEYVALGEWSWPELWAVLEKTEVYGDIYRYKYVEKLEQEKENLFYFNTTAQANKFYRKCKNHLILTEDASQHPKIAMKIYGLDNLKEPQIAMNTAKKIYSEIMNK